MFGGNALGKTLASSWNSSKNSSKSGHYIHPRTSLVFIFRLVGFVLIAVTALLLPQVGEHRHLLAGLLCVLVVPAALVITFTVDTNEHSWVDPLFDLIVTVSLVHLVPAVWVPALCIGLLVALAPSISLHPRSYLFYALNAVILLLGMGYAGWHHQVQDWWIPLLAIGVVYPSVIYYAHWQVRRADLMRERAALMQNVHNLAGGLAHDFNNVLTSVSGHVELAKTEAEHLPVAQADLDEAIASIERATLLCQQLESFALQQDSRTVLINLELEVQSIANLLSSVVPSGIDIRFHCTYPGVSVLGGRGELQQVLTNLILNVAQKTSHDDSPCVYVTVARTEEAHRFWAVTYISDRPIDLTTEGRFATEMPWFSNARSQYLLGFSTAVRAMRRHEGVVEMIDLLDSSSAVRVKLPLAPTRSSTPTPISKIRGSGLVLVVDDEPQVRAVISRMLKRLGFTTLMASNADEAVALLGRELPRVVLVVLDLKMPGKDGWTCLQTMRELKAELPVIICSGYDPDERRRHEFGGNLVFLPKPFLASDLDKALIDAVPANVERLGEHQGELLS